MDPADLHAVQVTGPNTTPLPGGRSRRTVNNVPVLEVSQPVAEVLADHTGRHLDPAEDTEYLIGHRLVMYADALIENGKPGPVIFDCNETLNETAKSAIGTFEDNFSATPPAWVASTHEALAELVSDHYGGIPIRDIGEALS
jgi:hypothetical protein